MQSLYHAAHAVLVALALLVLAICFLMMLFGWALHGFIAALVFSSFFVMARELRGAALARWPGRPLRAIAPRR